MTPNPSSRQQARAQGLKTYQAGIICKGDHGTLRLVSSGKCPECVQAEKAKFTRMVETIREQEREKAMTRARREVHREAAREAKEAEREARRVARKAAIEEARRQREAARRAAAREARRLQRLEEQKAQGLEVVSPLVATASGLAGAVALEVALKGEHKAPEVVAQAVPDPLPPDSADLIQAPGLVVSEEVVPVEVVTTDEEDLPPWM